MLGFERKRSFESYFNTSLIGIDASLDPKDVERLRKIREAWNFYEGYHWEDMPEEDSVELTVNYCRAFVDKFVAFELGKSFTLVLKDSVNNIPVMIDPEEDMDLLGYLNYVWSANDQDSLITAIGQTKSVTGDAWIQVRFFDSEELDDPFNEYPNGVVKLLLQPTMVVFPEYDPHLQGNLLRLTLMYQYTNTITSPITQKVQQQKVLYKQVWTKNECITYDGNNPPLTVPNKYGVIPFVQIKNLSVSSRNEGRSDLEDIIPLNTEYNRKQSNISEIIDYHAAPVTIVYGAKIGNLEKGANKMWGGLSEKARVENLELKSDLSSSANFVAGLKLSMCEVAGIPESVLGGSQAISNTSGVALQYINLPLIEKTRIKKGNTIKGIQQVNKLILLISLMEGIIKRPTGVSNSDFYYSEVTIPDTLPKDMLLELQAIQQEMKLGLESRANAMQRIGQEDIEKLTEEIDADMEKHPILYGQETPSPAMGIQGGTVPPGDNINSGMINGQTAIEQVRNEVTGKNGGATE